MRFDNFKIAVVFLIVSVFYNTDILSQCNNDVGTIKGMKDFYGQSTKHDLSDTVFLCWRDRFLLEHNNDFDLQSDPDMVTPAGIGYCWYKAKPTRTGDTEAEIKLDKDFKLYTDPLNLVISVGELNGDIEFENGYYSGSKSFNDYVNTVGSDPTLMYYAPITFDVKKGKRGYFENGGKCVKVGADQSFPVVYLNPIEISDIIYDVDGDSLKLSFIVKGGIPEFYKKSQNKTVNYSFINVYDDYYYNNPQGDVLTQNFSHGDRVIVKVPVLGKYNVVIEDGYSCTSSNNLIVSDEITPTIMLDTMYGKIGDIPCLNFAAKDYVDITSGQGNILYNPRVLDFIDPLDQNDILSINDSEYIPGVISIDWFTNELTFLQKKDLAAVCFKIKPQAVPGECYPVKFERFNLTTSKDDVYPYYEFGLICVEPPDGLYANATHCGPKTGSALGSLTFKVYNGISPYTYVIKDGTTVVETGSVFEQGDATTVFGLPINKNYTIEITDANGVVYPFTEFISSNPPLEIESFDITQPGCFGDNSGQVSIKIKNGDFLPHSIEWSNSIYDRDTIFDLSNGYYGVTIQDGNTGCIVDTFAMLNTPRVQTEIEILDSASCVGVKDGRLKITSIGGNVNPNKGYTYLGNLDGESFSDNTFSSTIFDKVGGGTFNLRVHSDRDNFYSCFQDYDIEIPTKYQMQLSSNPTDLQCNGAQDGKITFNVDLLGWNNDDFDFTHNNYFPFPTSVKIDDNTYIADKVDVKERIYTFTDRTTGCSISDTIQLSEPEGISYAEPGGSPSRCGPDYLGWVDIEIFSGGVLPITLSGIRNDVVINSYSNSHRYDSLDVGDYLLIATDANGCEEEIRFTIDLLPDALFIDTIKYDLLGCNSSATTDILVEAHGKGTLKYKWSRFDGSPVGDDTNKLKDVGSGKYIVEISDDYCLKLDTIEILEGKPFTYQKDNMDAECAEGETGGFLGNACVSIDSGDAGFVYNWSNGESTKCISNLSAGKYNVTISDGNGCITEDSFEIKGAPPIKTDLLDLKGVSCNDGLHTDGKAIIEVSGGNNSTGVYKLIFDSGTKTGKIITVDNLAAGNNVYSISYNTINGNICTKLDSFEITLPEKLEIEDVTIFKPSCNGDCDGKARIKAKGGNDLAYFYKWKETAEIGAVGFDLCAGTYHIEIKDANDCTVIDSITIDEPEVLIAKIDSLNSKDVNCSGNNTGQVKVKFTGGNTDGPYNFKWSPDVSTTDLANDLPRGVYSVTVVDSKGCESSASYEVEGQSPLVFNVLQADTIKCFGDKTCIYLDTVYGGAGPGYTFSINGGAISPFGECSEVYASEEPYLVSVFDKEGCKEEKEILISQPEEIIVDLGDEIEIDLGEAKTIHLNTNTNITDVKWIIDTLAIEYEFLNNQHSELEISAYKNSTLYATVQDINGCEASGQLNVLVNTFRNVYIPNIFTPDGDGLNEEFKVTIGKGIKKINYFEIVNRWGELMHEEKNLLPSSGDVGSWDGTFKGRKVNPGVYVYLIEVEFLDDRIILYRGAVTVIR